MYNKKNVALFLQQSRKILLIMVLLLTACATSSQKEASHPDVDVMVSKQRSIAGIYESGQVSNEKPSSQEVIDEVQMKSQADYHFTLAEIYSASNNTQEAIAQFQKTLVYDPKSTEVLLKLASEYLKASQVTKAIASAEAVLEIDPKNHDATIFLGKLYVSIQMYPQAEAQYRKALSHHPADHPKSLEVSLYLGMLLVQQSKTKEATKIFKNVAKHSKEHKHLAYYYLGRIEQGQENISQAEKYYRESLKIQNDFNPSGIALAEIYEIMNQTKKSYRSFRKIPKRTWTQ